MNISFWEHDTYFNNVDVVVIGAGIVGLSTAINLKQRSPKLKVLVLERGELPNGASTKNAGFACFGSPTELLDDLESHNEDQVIALVRKRWKGLELLRSNLGDKNIDYQGYGGYELFDKEEEYERCEDNLRHINKLLKDVFGTNDVFSNADDKIGVFGFKNTMHLIYNRFEGQIDTGKMMLTLFQKAIAEGVIVINGMNVESIVSEERGKVLVSLGNKINFYAKKVLVATNGFAKKIIPALQVQPARSQVLVTSPIANLPFKGSFHFDKGYYYFRNIGDRVLLGGGRNYDMENEFTDEFAVTERIQKRLEEMLTNVILPGKKYEIERRWSGIMGVGSEKSTIIKEIEPSIFCAVRMGGMGVAIGSLVAVEAAEMLINS